MKRIGLLVVFLSISSLLAAQPLSLTKIADSIKAEGEALYRSEWASGHGTAIFNANYSLRKKLLSGGYLSYETKKDVVNIFFSKDEHPKVIATLKFDKRLDESKFTIDTITRTFNDTEEDLFVLREKAAKEVTSSPFFTFYENTSFNIIPIITNGRKKVYVVTAQTSPDIVLLGNDYLINFDEENNVLNKIKLHNNLIPLANGGNEVIEASSHQHLSNTSEFITATDVCAFKLWKPKITWVITFVVSAGYISAWHFRDEYFEILTQTEFAKKMKK